MSDGTQVLNIPYHWQGLDYTPYFKDEESGEERWGERKYTIFIWGHNHMNEETCWVVRDYPAHCYVRIEHTIENQEKMAPVIMEALDKSLREWVRTSCTKPSKKYLKSLSRKSRIVQGYKVEYKYPLFYYSTGKFLLYKVFFDLEVGMSACYEFLNRNPIKFANGAALSAKCFNNGQSDRITTEQKMIVELKLDRCNWMYGLGQLTDNENSLTKLANEYTVPYKSICKLSEEYSKQLGYPKPCTISFDAETWTPVYNRFPKAAHLRDCMYAIGFKYRKYANLRDTNPIVVNYLFIIWDKFKDGEITLPDEKEYGKCIIVYCMDELEFFPSIFYHIVKLDPSWFISFNGLGFDWAYVQTRCQVLDIKVPNISRLRNWNKTQFNVSKWKQWIAMWPQYPGRIDVDMLNIIRGQFKMVSYKLKNVTKELLPKEKGKVDLPYKTQFKIFGDKDLEGMGSIVDYLAMDIALPQKLYDKLSTSIYLHTNGGVMCVNPLQLYTTGQSIRCVLQLYERVTARNMFVDTREIMKSGKYIGGLVIKNIAGMHEDVIIFDFNSLYPSEMKEKNICFSTLINEVLELLKKPEDRIPDEDINVVEGDVPIVNKKKEIIGHEHHKFRFIKKHIRLGLLPEIVTNLNALRTLYKGEMKKCWIEAKKCKEDGDMEGYAKWAQEAEIWNVKQAAVKVSANSMYGFMGMKTGKYSFIEGGMATTISGQKALLELVRILKDIYKAFIVYGDTDSAMVKFDKSFITSENYPTKGPALAVEISKMFSDDLNLACENMMKTFLSFTPKRYAAIKINPENPGVFPTIEEIREHGLLYVKGLICVRGNTCAIIGDNFKEILLRVLIHWTFKEVTEFVWETVLSIVRRDYPLTSYTFVQRLGAAYKDENNDMAIFSERLKQLGRPALAGDEMEYVYMRTHGDTYKGNKMQPPDLFRENDNILDTHRYIKHCFAKPVEEILRVRWDDSELKPFEKKILQPRKPTKVQKVTPVWHLQLYIRRYILAVHTCWRNNMDTIRAYRHTAIEQGYKLDYVIDETHVAAKMSQLYGNKEIPAMNDEDKLRNSNICMKKKPIHRHTVWNNPAFALTNPK
jgi:DNA polymerase elongation subunit (family B)